MTVHLSQCRLVRDSDRRKIEKEGHRVYGQTRLSLSVLVVNKFGMDGVEGT